MTECGVAPKENDRSTPLESAFFCFTIYAKFIFTGVNFESLVNILFI
jgi:hypothetical protein